MNGQEEVSQAWIVVVTDEDGTEGVPACRGNHGMILPAITTDPDNIETMHALAERIFKERNLPTKIIRLTNKEIIKTFTPS